MQRKIDVMIFDLDGTLIDSKRDIAGSVNYTMQELGLPPLSDEIIYSFVGNGVTPLIEKSIAVAGAIDVQKALTIFKEHYDRHLLDTTHLFPGILEVLEIFQSKKMYVVTNKSQGYSEKILKGLKVNHFFQGTFGGDTSFPKKPAPDVILHILKVSGGSAEKTILIGDSRVDLETGKRAGVLTGAVTYGFRPREELEEAGYDYLIEKPEDLISFLV